MTNKEMIDVLKIEADKNPATKAALQIFCLRKRPRSTLTLAGLEHKMKKAGYMYSKRDYEPLLRILEFVGVGTLDLYNGRIKGLKNIKVTFQSIGKSVFGDQINVESRKQRNKFTDLKSGRTVPKPSSLALNLDLIVNGKHVIIPLPQDLNNQELIDLIGWIKRA